MFNPLLDGEILLFLLAVHTDKIKMVSTSFFLISRLVLDASFWLSLHAFNKSGLELSFECSQFGRMHYVLVMQAWVN